MEKLDKNIPVFKPDDFNKKWDKWLKEVHDVNNHIEVVEVFEEDYGKKIHLFFDSVANTKIFAILYLPTSPKAVVAYYHGHNSFIEQDHNVWHCMNLVKDNLAVMAIDMRFQKGRVIDTNDYLYKEYPSSLYNINNVDNSYNLRLCQDALKVIDIIKDPKCFKEIASLPLIAAGPSQGGGLSLMVGSFQKVDLIVPDVPSDCCLKERVYGRHGKYGVILDFINEHKEMEEQIIHDLAYFDVVNMADRISCPVFSSVGGIDEICPARFYYEAYKKIVTKKYIDIYDDYGHGGFEEIHLPKKLKFINEYLSR